MKFTQQLQVQEKHVLESLGYSRVTPDDATHAKLDKAVATIEENAIPRWISREFTLAEGVCLQGANVKLPGQDVERHLRGCTGVVLLAVTLGNQVEQSIRMAQAMDMSLAVMMDMAASVLIEQYAELAEEFLRKEVEAKGMYLTGRYSPGYGDLPIALQGEWLRLLDAPRRIGLSVSQSNILLPRKSITAVLGVAESPVTGSMAGCAHCALKEKCEGFSSGRALCHR